MATTPRLSRSSQPHAPLPPHSVAISCLIVNAGLFLGSLSGLEPTVRSHVRRG